ncbi:hypothetical protein KFK09_009944 [Dendrobium nobile]|uniref:Uncharacterized protein n=1 Tax=Dendrobium nobile TaxID=94219 RepID=A0A8T3BKS1_DENNO|nr:hypothetical protein KFK09_009944 [Dendrobium nobile]
MAGSYQNLVYSDYYAVGLSFSRIWYCIFSSEDLNFTFLQSLPSYFLSSCPCSF